jgi:hypothetical protein
MRTETAQTNSKRTAAITAAVGLLFLISAGLLWMVNASVARLFSSILLIWGIGGVTGGLVSLIRSRAEDGEGLS